MIAIAANACVPVIAFLFLESLHKLFYKIRPYRKFFDRFVEKARKKVHAQMEKYGYWGLMLFVAVPLPVTGAWTGALGAWVLGLSTKSIFCLARGLALAGIIVSVLVPRGRCAEVFFKILH